jgi:hypothetical protein
MSLVNTMECIMKHLAKVQRVVYQNKGAPAVEAGDTIPGTG